MTIDTTTGQATPIQTIGENVTGYGLAAYLGSLYTFNPNRNEIDQLSMIDGHIVSRRAFSVTGLQGEGDIAIRSDTGTGFVASAFDENGAPTHPLYAFSVLTGVAAKIGNTTVTIDGLAFDQNQTLYAVGQGDTGANDPAAGDAMLYVVNQATGVLTPVGSLGVPQNSPIAAITFAPDGTLFGAIDDQLYRISTVNGAATIVNGASPYLGVSSVSGLAFTRGVSNLVNIATRAYVGTGDNVEIAGFMVRPQASTSSSPAPTPSPGPSTSPSPSVSPTASPSPSVTPILQKEVIIRALGPSLRVNGATIAGALNDPTLTLHDGNGVMIAFNDNWKDNSQTDRDRIVATGLAPGSDNESVIVRTLPEGVYTAVVRGKADTTGIAIAEVYDTNAGNGVKLPNISTRSFIVGGDGVSISGIIIEGSSQKRVIFRGIGPSLQGLVPNPLPDPTMQLFDANGTMVAANDNWRQQDPNTVADIQGSGLAPSNDKESVIAVTLPVGNYTAVLQGAGVTTGTVLVEAYDRD